VIDDATRFLEHAGDGFGDYLESLRRLLVAIAMQDNEGAAWARSRLLASLTETMARAELHGARSTLRHAAGAMLEMGVGMRADIPLLITFRDSAIDAVASVPLQEAIDDLVTRTPVVLRDAAQRTGAEIARLYSQGRVVAFARSAEQAVTERVHAQIIEAMRTGLTTSEAVAHIRENVDQLRQKTEAWTDSYARTAFLTNVSTAVSAGRFRQVQDPAVQAVIPAFRFDSVNDADTRPNHRAADNHVWSVDNPVWNKLAPPLGFNCFLPGTRICGAVEIASKARYSGPAVEIKTEGGGWLAVTVNHPILTRTGWKPAGEIAEGDDLIRDSAAIEALAHATVAMGRRTEDEQHMPPCAQDVFEAIVARGTVPRRMLRGRELPLNLHGDARFLKGDIHVVSADWMLPERLHPHAGEPRRDLNLVLCAAATGFARHGESDTNLRILTPGAPERSLPGGTALAPDDAPVVGACLALRPLHGLSIGSAAQSNVRTAEVRGETSAADAEFSGKLRHAHAGQVAFDRVAEIRHFDFSGHVYDFQTRNGWIVAGGIVTSNCRCQVSMVTRPDLRRMGRLRTDGTVIESAVPPGAFPDPGFRHEGRPDLAGVSP